MIELLFDPVHPNAPSFYSLTFLVGCWGIMLGGFDLFERLTRKIREASATNPQAFYRTNGFRVTRETFEHFLFRAAHIGRTTAKYGAILILVAILFTIWRA